MAKIETINFKFNLKQGTEEIVIPVKSHEEALKISEEKDKEIQEAIINESLIHLQADARTDALRTPAFKFTLKGSEVISYKILYYTE